MTRNYADVSVHPKRLYDYFSLREDQRDHIRCQGRWEELPCYSKLRRTLSPVGLERRTSAGNLSRSNPLVAEA
jgi:hypothetical protein